MWFLGGNEGGIGLTVACSSEFFVGCVGTFGVGCFGTDCTGDGWLEEVG